MVFPTKFVPPPSRGPAPLDIFERAVDEWDDPCWTRQTRSGREQRLVFTDGACINNGYSDACAGWAVVVGPRIGNRLAHPQLWTGDSDDYAYYDPTPTSNRAEIEAVCLALQVARERFRASDTVVIATDSQLVVEGSTNWVKKWLANDWTSSSGHQVRNQDLWEKLLDGVDELDDCGLLVQFWHIPREWNTVADRAAKRAAENVGY